MKYEEFDSLFQKSALSLSYKEGLSLAIAICRRLLPDYEYFVLVEGWGSKDLLLDAIQLCEKASTQKVEPTQIEEMAEIVDAIIPDTEDFGEYPGSYALNAGASVYDTLHFILDKNLLHIYHIGTYLTDAVDFKIHEQGDTPDNMIDVHPMMVEARNFLLEQVKA